MPFTFSHPAIVLPLIRKYHLQLSATGLIAGSIAPDFEAFIMIGREKLYSHTWLGMLWYDLPLALALCILFHVLVKKPLTDHLPKFFAARFYPYRNNSWTTAYFKKHIPIVLLSLFIGIFSHLLWDAVTHLNFYYPDSDESTLQVFGIRVYIIVQYSCSLAGLLYILAVIYKMPRVEIKEEISGVFQFWLYTILVSILWGSFIVTSLPEGTETGAIMDIYIVLASFIWGLLSVSAIYAMIRSYRLRKLTKFIKENE